MSYKGFLSTAKETQPPFPTNDESLEVIDIELADEPSTEASVRPLTREQIETLVLEHFELANRLAWSLLNRWRIRLGEDDVRSATGAALCEAASRFDASRGVSFRTFLFYHLRGVLLKEITKRVSEHRLQVQDREEESPVTPAEALGIEWASGCGKQLTPEQILIKEQMAELCRKACAELDTLEQDIIFRFFVLEQSVVDIARDLGYCRCHVSRIKSQVLQRLSSSLMHLTESYDRALARSLPGVVADRRPTIRSSYTGGRGRRKKHLFADAA